MITKILRDDSYADLLRYLMAVRKSVTLDRIEIHNLVSLETAIREMELVFEAALRRSRIIGPAAHIIIGWRRNENPSVDQQKEAARRLIKRLGLQGHQSCIVVHNEAKGGQKPGLDGRHFETHICVNRVAFDGTVAKMAFEFVVGERACAEIAREMGFEVIPGRFNGLKEQMLVPGLGNTIGSIVASGKSTLASEIHGNLDRITALRHARELGWRALLSAFVAQGIDIIEGPPRKRTALKRGLVMVDRRDRRRKIKLSSLDSATEKWSSIALEGELGPMPTEWRAIFAANSITERAPPEQMVQEVSENEQPINGLISLEERIKGNPAILERLRIARAMQQWTTLVDAARQENIGIEPGYDHNRRQESGLVLVDLRDRTQRVKISTLDTPIEKWGRSSLEKDLGPWHLAFPAQVNKKSNPEAVSPVAANKSKGKIQPLQGYRAFNRKAAYADYLAENAATIAHNQRLRVSHRAANLALTCQHKAARDWSYKVRRARRDLIRAVFGIRSAAGHLVNGLMDNLFDAHMRRRSELDRQEREVLSARQAGERLDLLLWPDVLRAARRAHDDRIRFENEIAEQATRAAVTGVEHVRKNESRVSNDVVAPAASGTHGARWDDETSPTSSVPHADSTTIGRGSHLTNREEIRIDKPRERSVKASRLEASPAPVDRPAMPLMPIMPNLPFTTFWQAAEASRATSALIRRTHSFEALRASLDDIKNVRALAREKIALTLAPQPEDASSPGLSTDPTVAGPATSAGPSGNAESMGWSGPTAPADPVTAEAAARPVLVVVAVDPTDWPMDRQAWMANVVKRLLDPDLDKNERNRRANRVLKEWYRTRSDGPTKSEVQGVLRWMRQIGSQIARSWWEPTSRLKLQSTEVVNLTITDPTTLSAERQRLLSPYVKMFFAFSQQKDVWKTRKAQFHARWLSDGTDAPTPAQCDDVLRWAVGVPTERRHLWHESVRRLGDGGARNTLQPIKQGAKGRGPAD